MLNLTTNVLYVLDLALLIPALWVLGYLFAGAVSGNGARFSLGWPFCWLGLVWAAVVVLRVMGEIH